MLPIDTVSDRVDYKFTRNQFDNLSKDISMKALQKSKVGDLKKTNIIYDDGYAVVLEVVNIDDDNAGLIVRYVKFIEEEVKEDDNNKRKIHDRKGNDR